MSDCAAGILGQGTTARELALAFADREIPVAWAPGADPAGLLPGDGEPCLRLLPGPSELLSALSAPRVVMLCGVSDADACIRGLLPGLAQGDVLVDAGRSSWVETRSRAAALAPRGVQFVGLAIGGGLRALRTEPVFMAGGSPDAAARLGPLLERIAARTHEGPCVAHLGPEASGHFIGMVHDALAEAELQLLAEVYHLLRVGLGFDAAELARTFASWNDGPLQGYLVAACAAAFAEAAPAAEGAQIDRIVDRPESPLGAGRVLDAAHDLGVPVPSFGAAINARALAALRDMRHQAAHVVSGPGAQPYDGDLDVPLMDVHDALLAARMCTLSQGLHLIQAASDAYAWNVNPTEVVRLWNGGCVIRGQLLNDVRDAYSAHPGLPHLLLTPEFQETGYRVQRSWRRAVLSACTLGLPAPALTASLAYFDGIRSLRLPHNLTVALRDMFDQAGFHDLSDPDGPRRHGSW